MGVILGKSNEMGKPIKISEASEYIFGFVLLNDWSARDIQAWEYVPLGPFLAKNFATTISAWIITADALQPFKVSLEPQDPKPLKYLHEEKLISYDIPVDVLVKSSKQKEFSKIATTNYKYMYWTINQQITHHAVTGCSLKVGDLLGSGTISGKEEGTYGCLMESNKNSTKKVKVGDEERLWLEDGDTVNFDAFCQGNGYRIGFSDCSGTILSALSEDEYYD
jgi:fumarylacetoacetase